MNDLVSIVMPSYNTARYISESIQSVIDQTYKNWELIIVDDCSTDNTDDVVGLFNDSRIVYLKNDINSGAAVSRNRALREAKGRWIAFLDSDDIWLPEKLEKQLEFMKKNDYHFSYHAYKEINEMSHSIGIRVTGPDKITKAGMFCYCWPGCLTVMYDADYVGLIQINDLKKNNDYAMWLRVISKCECFYYDNYLAKYRIRSGSISRHSKIRLIKSHYLLYRDGEECSVSKSLLITAVNIFFGMVKKVFFVKHC